MGIRQRKAGRENLSNGCGMGALCSLECVLQSKTLSVEIITRALMLHGRSFDKFHSVDIEEVNG